MMSYGWNSKQIKPPIHIHIQHWPMAMAEVMPMAFIVVGCPFIRLI
jgi:hypothetical protein